MMGISEVWMVLNVHTTAIWLQWDEKWLRFINGLQGLSASSLTLLICLISGTQRSFPAHPGCFSNFKSIRLQNLCGRTCIMGPWLWNYPRTHSPVYTTTLDLKIQSYGLGNLENIAAKLMKSFSQKETENIWMHQHKKKREWKIPCSQKDNFQWIFFTFTPS